MSFILENCDSTFISILKNQIKCKDCNSIITNITQKSYTILLDVFYFCLECPCTYLSVEVPRKATLTGNFMHTAFRFIKEAVINSENFEWLGSDISSMTRPKAPWA